VCIFYVAHRAQGRIYGTEPARFPPKEDPRTPPKLPKLEYVPLHSAETGAKMPQNTQICKLNFRNFPGAMPPDPHTWAGLRRLSPDPIPSARLPRLARGLRSSIVPPTKIPGSTPGRTHPLKILATAMLQRY